VSLLIFHSKDFTSKICIKGMIMMAVNEHGDNMAVQTI